MSLSGVAAGNAAFEMDENLSIINPFPKLLEGPRLLHLLIAGPRTDAVALEYTDADGKQTCLSYAELHHKAERLALRLIQHRGQTSESRPEIVPLYITQCPSLYISILGILKSGAAFCPLNMDVPEERLKFILKDTGAKLLLTTSELRSKLPVLQDVVVINVDEKNESNHGAGEGDALSPFTPADSSTSLAYIMYTSGSTGLPKAVCLTHLAVTQSLLAHDRHIPLFARFLQFASPTFDVSVFEIFFPWIRGSTLVSCDRGRLLSDLPGTITSLNIDAAELTPSVAASLVRKRENVPTLKTLLTIGEMLNVQVIQEFGGSESQASMLYGMYGPTEAAIHCTLQPQFGAEMPAGTIGIPLDTVSCLIVKPAESSELAGNIEILPLGEVGELAVGGHQLASGYLNRDEQTRAAFVSHPKYGNLYRTGDKARLLPDGVLECRGRISSGQVKLRGQRIELGEIEHAASKVSGCHAVVANVISGQLIVFCIVEDVGITIDDIKNACRKWLPNYMVPNDVVLLTDFPYLPSGKVDKRTLESDYKSRSESLVPETSSVSGHLKKLSEVIERVLKIDIGPSTEFGAVGLDSLKAIQVASEVRREGFERIGALDLLAARTIQDLEPLTRPTESSSAEVERLMESKAQLLKELTTSTEGNLYNADQRQNLQEVLPCTPLQDAMLSETAKNPQAYCNSFSLYLPLDTDLSRLRQCMHNLAEKHALLRSGFVVSGTAISAYSQLTWKQLDDSVIVNVDDFDNVFSMPDQAMLLRPLRIQCKRGGADLHVLFQMHHALYDQWSIEILIQDLNELLRGGQVPQRSTFGAVNNFFLDLKLSSPSQSDSAEFWQAYLSGAIPGHLPSLNEIREPPSALAVSDYIMKMDVSVLRDAAQANNCSPHVFFQAAFTYLLSMYMGSTDVTFGTVFSGRTLAIPDVENIFGPVLSTLPTRVDISESRKFSDILHKLHGDNRDIMQHSTMSLADIRKACGASSGLALFDSIFVWQETARASQEGEALVKLVDTRDYLEFNLTMELEPSEVGIRSKATYQPAILPAKTVDIMLRQIESVVKYAIKQPDALIDDIGACFPASLLSMDNEEPQNFVYNKGLGSVVERHAADTPDKAALCFASDVDGSKCTTEVLTYEELNIRANRLAHHLVAIGTQPDELVCICMEKSLDLYVGILAIVKTGAAYLPLVPETPPARLSQILIDAKVKTCLTDNGTSSTIGGLYDCKVIDVLSIDVSQYPSSNPDVIFDPSHQAYAVFTSGTTGKPKGVLVTQENILSNLTVLEKIYPVHEGSRLLQACNQAFDVSVFEIFFSWFTGMCLCSATKDVTFRDLENTINQLGVTHLSMTPTVAALVDPLNVPSVEFLVTAGEAVTPQVHNLWAGKGLHQGYGPSETTNICTVNPAVQPGHVINNIGPAFENTSAFVLARSSGFHPLPIGALGELCFGGQQVFRGYQNMRELTESKIIDHPEYGRIYRSGDLGRMLPNGTILIEGRVDDQRKLRGQRIELGEISSALLRLPAVHDCSVQIVGENKQQERLVGFWVPADRVAHDYSIVALDEGIRKEIGILFNALSDELPAYMIPNILVPISTIPRTGQGKIDRRRLVEDAMQLSPVSANGFSQAFEDNADGKLLSDVEQSLLTTLAEVLQISASSIGRTMSFFAVGLDSVSAIRFSRAIKASLGVQVDVSTILKRSTVARLAASVEKIVPSTLPSGGNDISNLMRDKSSELVKSVVQTLQPHGKTAESIFPCTPLQEAMLSASSSTSTAAYYNRTLFKISGDMSKMRDCWRLVSGRHEMLRTAFMETDDARFPYVQVVLSDADLHWEDKGALDGEPGLLLQADETDEMIPVLGSQPPYKLKIFEAADDRYVLLEMHHAMYDGNAMSNLLRDVENLYQSKRLPDPIRMGPFLDHMLSTDLEAADDFFRSHLNQYLPKPFPRCKSVDGRRGFDVKTTRLSVSQTQVQDFLQKHSVSLLGLVQAAWAKVLSISQGHPDICFGNVVSGRSVPVDGVQALVAPCFNTIPVRVDVSQARNNLSLIRKLQKTNVDMLPYQLVPLRRLQAKLSVDGQHLFDSLILLQQEPVALDERIWSMLGESGEMDFPCIVEVTPSQDDSFHVSLHFDCGFFADANVPGAMCNAFVAAFASCFRYPASETSDMIDFSRHSLERSLMPDETVLAKARATLQERALGQGSKAVAEEEWSSMELEIRQAFSAISGTPEEKISKDTTIYKIGLDSISAIQVASRLRKKGIALTAGDVMESPSCSQLASLAQSLTSTPIKHSPAFDLEAFDRRHRPAVVSSLKIEGDNIAAVRPCTAVQAGMLTQYLQSDRKQYLNHTFYLLDTTTDALEMATAWAQILERHEMLRTGFASTDDAQFPFAMITYTDVSAASTQLQHTRTRAKSVPFEERQQAALDDIHMNIHLPPWRWDLFEHDGKSCLQFSAHHATFDAETLRILQLDLRQALNCEHVPSRDSIDSALSLILTNSSSDKQDQQAFWAGQFSDLSMTRFPNLCPVRSSGEGSVVSSAVCKAPRSQLEGHCRDKGISLQAAGQAAWARLLAAYTGESRVTFGVVSSGRNTPETVSAPFPCITTLPITSDTSVTDDVLLNSLTSYNGAIQKYQFTPLSDVQRYAGLPNEPLFDTLFAYQKPLEEDSEPQWQVVHESASVDYPISIEMEALVNDKLGIRLTTNTGQVPARQGQFILEQLEALILTVLGASPANNDDCLSIVAPKEAVLPTSIQYLHEFVGSTVASYPDRIALEFVYNLEGEKVLSQSWTYRQLDEESNRVAQLLIRHGVKPNGVVAASFDKCPEASFAFIGILKAGCAFCAIDPTAPTARKTFILEDSKATLLLTSAGIVSELKDFSKCTIIDLINNDELREMPTEPVAVPDLSPSSISYVLYTSGTTGTPKGCELTHDNAVQAMLAFQRIFAGRWTEHSRWLQFASYHFDVAVVEQFWTWSVGIRLVCAQRDLILEDLAGFIDTMKISHLDLTPSLGRLLDPTLVPSLHSGVFITGGEAVKQDMIESWGDFGCLFNFYGPTECTIGVTTFPSVPRNGKPSNIGWQFDNVGAYVLAPGTKTPVLRGAIGELCISGRLVGKGYLNRPELTADRFPHLELYNERVYRTGDLVRILHDDSIDFLGRQDNQVKLRGQRLEIDEIEAVIRGCPEIQDIVCLVAKHPKQQKDLLVAFIGKSSKRRQGQPHASTPESMRDVIGLARTACEEHLPGYMVPTHFVPVDEIPLSVNNKVEEKQLRHLYSTLPTSTIQQYSAQTQDVRPLNESERSISRALASLLKIDLEELHGSTNVFALGLSSISAIQFARKLKSEGFEGAHVTTIMKNPTISRLGKALNSSPKQDGGEILAAKQSISVCRQRYGTLAARTLGGIVDDYEAIAPCTPLQQGIISRSMNAESSLYFNSFRYKLRNIDTNRLHNAFQSAVDGTQVLRTAFIETDDGYVQVVKKSAHVLWIELEAPSEEAAYADLGGRKQKWRRLNAPHLVCPFEIAIVNTPQEKILEVHIHHAVYDGNSYEMLLESVTQLYRTGSATFGQSFIAVLPYGPLRHTKGAKDFWLDHLSEAARQSMPTLGNEAAQDTLSFTPVNQLSGANELRKTLNVTLQAVVQAAWLATLRKYYQGGIGTVVSGRSIDCDGAETVIGPLFNTIPFNPRLSGDTVWKELVQSCHNFNISALPFQHTPLRDITKWCRAGPADPLFDTLFVFQGAELSKSDGTIFVAEEETQFQADYPLSFEVGETSDGQLGVTISAQGSICSKDMSQQLVMEFSKALSCLISEPSAKIGESLSYDFKPTDNRLASRTAGQDLNGVHDFVWSQDALTLRHEIAQLAAVDESEVDEHVSIFELGLDSVDAVKLSSRLKKKFLSVPVSALMRSQTIPRILDALSKSKPTVTADGSKNVLKQAEIKLSEYAKGRLDQINDIERVLPASPMQEALISEMIGSSYDAYFNHDVLQISQDVDIEKLEKAWGIVVSSSPILRTGFLEVDDPNLDFTFAQIIKKPDEFHFNRVQVARDDFQGYMEQTQRSFSSGPSTRPHFALALASTSSENYLILSIAHALYDGFSLSLLHQDVSEAYNDQFKPRPAYDEVLDQALAASDNGAVSFWRSLLSGAARTHIPANSQQMHAHATTYRKEQTSAVSSATITAFCRKQGVTAQSLCQTAWALVLAHYTTTIDVMYGVVLAGRDSQVADQVMFPTMNTVVMRSVLHGSRNEMLQYMQGTLADIVEHQHFPLRKIQAACQKDVRSAGSTDSSALFNTLFTFQKSPSTGVDSSDALYNSVVGASDVDYPIAIEAEVTEEGLVWRTSCKNSVFSESETETMLRQLDLILEEIISRPESPSLEFEGQRISICGLPSFTTSGADATLVSQTSDVDQDHAETSGWSELESEIRQVIVQVTRTPQEETTKSAPIQNLGVDSINAIKIAALLRKKSIKISVSQIIKAGSIANMVALLTSTQAMATPERLPSEHRIERMLSHRNLTVETLGLDTKQIERVLPATAGQVYMLNSWQTTKGQVFFPEFEYILKGGVTATSIKTAWHSLVAKHSILRTVFYATSDSEMPFLQLIRRSGEASFIDLDKIGSVRGTTPEQPYASLSIRKVEKGLRLGLKIHHALYDAISLPMMITNLRELLKSSNTVPPAGSFTDFIALSAGNGSSQRRKDFWTQYLQDAQPLQLPISTAAPDSRRTERFDPAVMQMGGKEEAALRRQGVSLQSLFFAAYSKAYVASIEADEDRDIIIGLYMANRSHSDELSTLVAPTVNLVPVRVRAPKSTDIISIAKQIQNDLKVIGTAEISATALWEIERWTGVKVDTIVNFIKLPDAEEQNRGSEDEIVIEDADNGVKTEKRSLLHPVNKTEFTLPEELQNNSVIDAYPVSYTHIPAAVNAVCANVFFQATLDIEATVANGALGIGVFAWEDMVGLEQAEKLIKDVEESLREALEA